MCVVSMIGDHYFDKWRGKWPTYPFSPTSPQAPDPIRDFVFQQTYTPVTRQEFDQLKKEVAEMVALLKRAKDYDERNGEPECETDEKMRILREVAKLVGVDLDKELGK